MEEGARQIVRLQRLIATTKPVVVEVGGPVRAGGIGIVAASDIAISADTTTYALTEVKLGLAPAVISLTVLPRLTSRAAALTCLGGEVFDGSRAAEMGLVTRAVPEAELDDAVDAVVSSLMTGAAQGLRETKALLARDLLDRIDARGDEVAALSARLFGSDEAREAMLAFLSRKK
jgi:enoyl-CoA hydratase/methylglutaconyl-CoA hydratase